MTTTNLVNPANLQEAIRATKMFILTAAMSHPDKVCDKPQHVVCYETEGDDQTPPELFAVTLVTYESPTDNSFKIMGTTCSSKFQHLGQAYMTGLFETWKKSGDKPKQSFNLEDHDDFFAA